MSNENIVVSVKDIPEVIEAIKNLQQENKQLKQRINKALEDLEGLYELGIDCTYYIDLLKGNDK